MSRMLPLLTCLLLLCASQAEGACEREWAELLSRQRAAPGTTMDFFDSEIRSVANDNSRWSGYTNIGPRPTDPVAALRRLGDFFSTLRTYREGNFWVNVNYPFEACRARFLADQLDAPRIAREQAARDAATRALLDRQARDQAARAAAERERLRQEELRRNRELRAIQETERLKLQQEADAERAREDAAREAEEQKRYAAEEAAYQRELKAYNDRLKKDREEKKRLDEATKPFEARNVSECISLLQDENTYGGFRNRCDFPVYVAYCAFMPTKGEFSSGFDCDKDQGGLDHVAAHGVQAAHTKNVVRMYWFACNAPSTPNVTYRAGGLSGTCR